MVRLIILLSLEPVRGLGGTGGGLGGNVLALNLDGHGLVGGEVAGEVGLLGGNGGLGLVEGLDLANGVRGLDNGGLVGVELLEVQLLDEVGWGKGRGVSIYTALASWARRSGALEHRGRV